MNTTVSATKNGQKHPKIKPADNAFSVLQKSMQMLRVPVHPASIRKALQTHDQPQSILALTEALDQWQIASMSIQIDASQLQDLPAPTILYTQKNNGTFVVLIDVSATHIRYYEPGAGTVQATFETFQQQWPGIALIMEANAHSHDPDYQKHQQALRLKWSGISLAVLVALMVLGFTVYQTTLKHPESFLPWMLLLGIKLSGFTVGVLLVASTLSAKGAQLAQRFCSIGKNSNCNTILTTRAAKIFSWLSLSEIGLFYFAGGTLVLMAAPFTGELSTSLQFFAATAVLALPFTLFSVYYQGVVARTWCPLCLITMALFWLEFAVLFTYLKWPANGVSLLFFMVIVIGFFAPAVLWLSVRGLVYRSQRLQGLERELLHVAKDPGVFDYLTGRAQPANLPALATLQLGDRSASLQVKAFLSLSCPACAAAYEDFKQLVRTHEEGWSLDIILLPKEKDHALLAVMLHPENQTHLPEMLDDWYTFYNKGNTAKWSSKWKKHPALEEQPLQNTLAPLYDLMAQRKIHITPSFFIQQQKVPPLYSSKTLLYHIRKKLNQAP